MNIALEHINKSFMDFNLLDIDLEVRQNEFFVILGPSGAGKTLILEIIAGLVRPDSGQIRGVDQKKIGFIYQDYWLFPHLNVFDNIAYGLKIRKTGKPEIRKKVEGTARRLDILPLLNRRTAHLSGGEKQRVAIARALAISPDLFLFDEPTASLDRSLRLKTRNIFLNLHRESPSTFIHVTHDFEEALSLADRMAILMEGRIVQCGKPDEVFNHPRSREVADFLGYRNVFSGSIRNGRMKVNGLSVAVPANRADFAAIAIRADDIIISRKRIQSSARNAFLGKVLKVVKKSSVSDVTLDVGFDMVVEITRKSCEEMRIKPGDRLWATFKVSSIKVFKHE
jgi:molybdate/tungstate transport system ATP-binding protein